MEEIAEAVFDAPIVLGTVANLEQEVSAALAGPVAFFHGLLAVEFRLRDGNHEFFPYALLAPWRHNPSVGIPQEDGAGVCASLIDGFGCRLTVRVGT